MRTKGFSEVESRWREILSRQKGSGLSARLFCDENGIAVSSFYYWTKRFKRVHEPAFLPVKVRTESGIRLRFVNGAQVEFSSAPDPVWLAEVLRKVAA